jgi:acyl-coenzyme A thioesterase PaaI-like protein
MTHLRSAWPDQCADVECHEISAAHVLVSQRPSAAVLRPGGFISGPEQFAIADLGMWCAVWGVLNRIELMALTSEMSIRFVRPAVGSVLWARINVNAVRPRTVVSSATMWTDACAEPCAIAQGTYVIPRTDRSA